MKRHLKLLTIFLLSAVLFTGCGSSSGKSSSYDTADTGAYRGNGSGIYTSAAMADSNFKEEESVSAPTASAPSESAEVSEQTPNNKNRKLITRMNMEVQTEYFDELQVTIEKRVNELGGYIESSDLWNGSGYNRSGKVQRTLSLVIRVPADKLDSFVQTMSDNSNIVSSSKNVEDVTLTYVDLESHKTALQTEEKRLLELMEKAESMEDLITIESRLTDVRYQLQSMESQLRTYDNMIDYSTISLTVDEVERITPPIQKSAKDRIVTGISESFYDVAHDLKEFGINFIIDLPYIIVWLIIIILFILLIRFIISILGGKERRIRRAQRKEEKRQRRIRAKEEKIMRSRSGYTDTGATPQSKAPAPEKPQGITPPDSDTADHQ